MSSHADGVNFAVRLCLCEAASDVGIVHKECEPRAIQRQFPFTGSWERRARLCRTQGTIEIMYERSAFKFIYRVAAVSARTRHEHDGSDMSCIEKDSHTEAHCTGYEAHSCLRFVIGAIWYV
ncbi:hypothetical protein BD626DRAFT_476536 [Schizophyllum amplum]|uniref:Uncharacterized protein n=1 Tax=Schizophyllum amplum TaxID=97359 RepID=A0A550CZG2_9AGAR|nr:hypothetical protein BD626DRAFT_476536 [Auriculariopsis ampla]